MNNKRTLYNIIIYDELLLLIILKSTSYGPSYLTYCPNFLKTQSSLQNKSQKSWDRNIWLEMSWK